MANVHGPMQDPHGGAGVAPIFAGAAIAGRPVIVFGDSCEARDHGYVLDGVAAWLAAACSAPDPSGEITRSHQAPE
jgi:nucleoside-diphosphate-sugar epimerase